MTLAKTPGHYLAAEIFAAQHLREFVPEIKGSVEELLETELELIPPEQRTLFLEAYYQTLERNAPCNQPVRLTKPVIKERTLVKDVVADGLRQLDKYDKFRPPIASSYWTDGTKKPAMEGIF